MRYKCITQCSLQGVDREKVTAASYSIICNVTCTPSPPPSNVIRDYYYCCYHRQVYRVRIITTWDHLTRTFGSWRGQIGPRVGHRRVSLLWSRISSCPAQGAHA